MKIRLFLLLVLICSSPLLLLSSRSIETVELLPDQQKSITINFDGTELIISVPETAVVTYNMTMIGINSQPMILEQGEFSGKTVLQPEKVGIYQFDLFSEQFVVIEIDANGVNQPFLIFIILLLVVSLILYRRDIILLFSS